MKESATPAPAPSAYKARSRSYAWQGIDARGKRVHGELASSSVAMVGATLRRRGIRVDGVRPMRPLSNWNKRIAAKEMTVVTRQLATMLNAGVPLLQSLDILAESQANQALVRLLHAIRSDIETGSSLSEALAKYPRHFDALFCNLTAAGEQAGTLDQLLTRLADTQERNGALRNRVRAALIYPIAILAVALLVTAIIMIWVVPAFRDVVAGFGAELPLATRMVIALSAWFVRYWTALLIGGAAAPTLCFHYWKRSITIQRMVDRLLLKLPVFGPLATQACVARWSRTLATMFAAGVPLLSSMEIVGKSSGNALYLAASRQIRRDLNEGRGLAQAIGNTRRFPNLVVQMAAIGEESGTLDRMLGKTADFYETEFNQALGTLSSIIEPVIMVALGGLVGTLVIAMYLPIFQLGAIV